MSQSPRGTDQVEPISNDTTNSPPPAEQDSPLDNDGQPTSDQQNDPTNSGDMSVNRLRDEALEHSIGYDFEVKEQDRWLPIANGESLIQFFLHYLPLPYLLPIAPLHSPVPVQRYLYYLINPHSACLARRDLASMRRPPFPRPTTDVQKHPSTRTPASSCCDLSRSASFLTPASRRML